MLCEEGNLEYDDEELAGANAVLEIIEEEEDFNEDSIKMTICKIEINNRND